MASGIRTIPLDQNFQPTCIGRNGTMWMTGIEVQTVDGGKHGAWASIIPINSRGNLGNGGFYGIAPADARRLAAALIEMAEEAEAWRWQLPDALNMSGESETYTLYPIDHYKREFDIEVPACFVVTTDDRDFYFDAHQMHHKDPPHVRAANKFKELVEQEAPVRLVITWDDGDSEVNAERSIFAYGRDPEYTEKIVVTSNC